MTYRFVPLADSVRRLPRKMRPNMTVDRRVPGYLSGSVSVLFECSSPVHVGSGTKRLDGASIIRETVRSAGRLTVPGSTLKGAIRSRFESISRSCCLFQPPGSRFPARLRSRSEPNIREGRLHPTVLNEPVLTRCGERAGICPACALFGFQDRGSGQRGRIAVEDFLASLDAEAETLNLPEQFAPNLHHLGEARVVTEGHRRVFEVRSLHGRKFATGDAPLEGASLPVEVIPRSTRLSGRIHFSNLSPVELGGLIIAASLDAGSYLRVGAAKGYGWGAIFIPAPNCIDWRIYDELRRSQPEAIADWTAAFRASEDCWSEGASRLTQIFAIDDLR